MKKFVLASFLLIVFGAFVALSLSGSTNTVTTSNSKSGEEGSISRAGTGEKCVIKCKTAVGTRITACVGDESCLSNCDHKGEKCVVKCKTEGGTWVASCKGDKTCLSYCDDSGEHHLGCKKGHSDQGFLGVYLESLNEKTAQEQGFSGTDGVLVTGIVDDSPAEDAGLEKGDIVVEAGGEKMEDYDDFEEMIESTGAGNELTVKVFRDGEEKTFTATLDEDKESFVWSWGGSGIFPGKFKIGKGVQFFGGDHRGHIGAYVQDLNSQLEEYFKVEGGVLITEVLEDRPGAQAGLEAGDVIISLADKDVEDEEELFDILGDTEPDDIIKVGIVRNGKKKIVEVTLDNPYIPNYGYLGVKFEEINDQLKDYFDVKHGVLITEVIEDSPAEKAGMKAGDVVIRFGDDKIKDNEDLVEAVHDGKPGDKVEITIIRDKKELKIEAELERAKQKHWNLDIFGAGDDEHSFMFKLNDMFELREFKDELEDLEIDVKIEENLEDIEINLEGVRDDLRVKAEEIAQKMAQMRVQERIQNRINDRIQRTIHENLRLEDIQEQLEQIKKQIQLKIEAQRLSKTL